MFPLMLNISYTLLNSVFKVIQCKLLYQLIPIFIYYPTGAYGIKQAGSHFVNSRHRIHIDTPLILTLLATQHDCTQIKPFSGDTTSSPRVPRSRKLKGNVQDHGVAGSLTQSGVQVSQLLMRCSSHLPIGVVCPGWVWIEMDTEQLILRQKKLGRFQARESSHILILILFDE